MKKKWVLWLAVAIVSFFCACKVEALTITWDANKEADLAGYKVYYGISSGNYHTNVDVGNQTSYKISGIENNKNHYIAVTAYDTSGNESEYSKELTGSIDTIAPKIPTGVMVKRITIVIDIEGG